MIVVSAQSPFAKEENPRPPPPPWQVLQGEVELFGMKVGFFSDMQQFLEAERLAGHADDAFRHCDETSYDSLVQTAKYNLKTLLDQAKKKRNQAETAPKATAIALRNQADQLETDADSWAEVIRILEKNKAEKWEEAKKNCPPKPKQEYQAFDPDEFKNEESTSDEKGKDGSQPSSGSRLRLGTGFPLPIAASYGKIHVATDSGKWCTYGAGSGSPKSILPADQDGNPIVADGTTLIADGPTDGNAKPGGKPAIAPPGNGDKADTAQGAKLVEPATAQAKPDDKSSKDSPKETLPNEERVASGGDPGYKVVEPGSSQAKPAEEEAQPKDKSGKNSSSKQRKTDGKPTEITPPDNLQGGPEKKGGDSVLKFYTPGPGPGYPVAKADRSPPTATDCEAMRQAELLGHFWQARLILLACAVAADSDEKKEEASPEKKKEDSVLKFSEPGPGPGYPVSKADPPPSPPPAASGGATLVSRTPTAPAQPASETPSSASATPDSTIHVTFVVKATEEAEARGQQASSTVAQTIQIAMVLPPKKPDLPGLHRADGTPHGQDDGFDGEPTKCVVGSNGRCTIDLAESDRQIYGIPSFKGTSNRDYRVDLDLPKTDGAVVELPGKTAIPDLSKGLPQNVKLTSLAISVGDRTFLRLSAQSPAASAFALVDHLRRLLGSKVVVDICRDIQPGPFDHARPASFADHGRELPASRLSLRQRADTTGAAP